MPKIRITAGGLYGANGELKIGDEFTVKEVPEQWAERVLVIDENAKPEKTVATGQIEDDLTKANGDKLRKIAADETIDLGEATSVGDLRAVIRKARADRAEATARAAADAQSAQENAQ